MAAVLSALDLAVLAMVLGAVFVIGLGVSWQGRNAMKSADFFLGGRNMSWWAIAGSLFASNIGTEHFVGQAGSGAASGIPVSLYEWTAGWLIVLLGEFFAPVYLRARVTTIPEFCEHRFGPSTRVLVSALSLVACVVTKISASIFAGSILLNVVAGWTLWQAVPVIIIATGVYTVGGGLEAVMYTDVLQAGIFVGGGIWGAVIASNRVGGWSGMKATLSEAGLHDHLHLLRPSADQRYPTSGIFTGLIVSSVWYWCVDQVIVQRVLSARSLGHARAGCVAAGYAKLLPPFMMVWPGVAARVLYERCRLDVAAGGNGSESGQDASWCATRLDDPDRANAAYPELILREFPPGMVGLMVAAMVCAMMSSLSSNFNSASTVFTCDVYHRFISPAASERELIWCGRLTTAATCALALAWLPIVAAQRGEFYLIVQDASSHLAPALGVVVTLGVSWRRISGPGALAGLGCGSLLGIVQYAISLSARTECDAAGRVDTFACMHFTHFAGLLGLATAVVTVSVSLCTAPPSHEAVQNTVVDFKRDGTCGWNECCAGKWTKGGGGPINIVRRATPHVRMRDEVDLSMDLPHREFPMEPVTPMQQQKEQGQDDTLHGEASGGSAAPAAAGQDAVRFDMAHSERMANQRERISTPSAPPITDGEQAAMVPCDVRVRIDEEQTCGEPGTASAAVSEARRRVYSDSFAGSAQSVPAHSPAAEGQSSDSIRRERGSLPTSVVAFSRPVNSRTSVPEDSEASKRRATGSSYRITDSDSEVIVCSEKVAWVDSRAGQRLVHSMAALLVAVVIGLVAGYA